MVLDAPNAPVRLRAFGTSAEDLDVDLTASDRPRVVTEILTSCVLPRRDADFYWDLPVGTRTEYVLALAALDGADTIDVEFRCAACGAVLEIGLPLDELLARERAAVERMTLVSEDGSLLDCRRPTGRDQAELAAEIFADERSLRQALARRLCGHDGALDDATIDRLEGALDEGDPLLRASVDTSCPDCGQASTHEADLTAAAILRLQSTQYALLETVHVLASRYHWTEDQILSLPPWRREQYLTRVARENVP